MDHRDSMVWYSMVCYGICIYIYMYYLLLYVIKVPEGFMEQHVVIYL